MWFFFFFFFALPFHRWVRCNRDLWPAGPGKWAGGPGHHQHFTHHVTSALPRVSLSQWRRRQQGEQTRKIKFVEKWETACAPMWTTLEFHVEIRRNLVSESVIQAEEDLDVCCYRARARTEWNLTKRSLISCNNLCPSATWFPLWKPAHSPTGSGQPVHRLKISVLSSSRYLELCWVVE